MSTRRPFSSRAILWELRRLYLVPVPCLVGDLWSAKELRELEDED